MQPIPPFWFIQRQAKATPVGEDVLRLNAPNLPEAFITARCGDNGLWFGAFRMVADGPDTVVTDPKYDNPLDAWNAAFELYRLQVVV